MKKLLTTMAVAFVATGVFAQGTLYTLSSPATVSTNGTSIGQGTGLTAGTGYIYALLENASAAVTGGTISSALLNNTNPLDTATWTFSGVYMTNINNGLLSGGLSVADAMWAPNTTNAFLIVGWSVNEGTTWAQIAADLTAANTAGGNWATEGYYGVSSVGFGQPGGGSPANPAFHLFSGASGLGTGVSGFTLYAVPVPEPMTLALTGLGGLSLLLFRRQRK